MEGFIIPNETCGTKIKNIFLFRYKRTMLDYWIDLNKLYKTMNIIALHDV